MQQLIFTNQVREALTGLLDSMPHDKTFWLADTNTATIARSLTEDAVITIGAGDENKNLSTLAEVWEALSLGGATRRSILVNVGGGMVTDLGGFAAACFKRGIRFINVPTTILGSVDAATGGKTGINFLHFKNEIGAFREAEAVIISSRWFCSLPQEEYLSGFAEMLKHGLISSRETYTRLLGFELTHDLLPLVEESVNVKRKVVEQDPHEEGLRKSLNLGHTIGHAFESHALNQGTPVPHGVAVAHGLLVEMILSHMLVGFPSADLYAYAAFLREKYNALPHLTCNDYPALLELMKHDKKNPSADHINFTLLQSVGTPVIDRTATPDQITEALDIYRDLLGL